MALSKTAMPTKVKQREFGYNTGRIAPVDRSEPACGFINHKSASVLDKIVDTCQLINYNT